MQDIIKRATIVLLRFNKKYFIYNDLNPCLVVGNLLISH